MTTSPSLELPINAISQPSDFLSGERVVLRPLQANDAEGPYPSWLNDAEVCQYNSHNVELYTQEMALDYISHSHQQPDLLALAVTLKSTGEHIGNMCLQRIHPVNQNAEYAVLMGNKKYWGQGYAIEAARLLCRHGFEVLNLHRIYCATHADNMGMQKLALSLGMKLEGRQRQAQFKHGVFADNVLYGMLRDEFFKPLSLTVL